MALEPAWGERFRLGAGITTGDRVATTSHPVLWMRRKPNTIQLRNIVSSSKCTERLRTPKISVDNFTDSVPVFLLNGLKLPSDSFRILRHFLKASGKQLATHHFEGAKLMDFPWIFAEANPWITNPIPKKMIVKMGILPK